jgi:hypothetical protein
LVHNTYVLIGAAFLGKTWFEYLETINEMVDRNFVEAPKQVTMPFITPEPNNELN